MKKIYFLMSMLVVSQAMMAQTSDMVTTTAGYANQVWYSLSNDEQASAPKAEWDIAFAVDPYSSSIHINSAAGVKLWTYPNGDISDWSTEPVITNIDNWPVMYNSETSWHWGAFDQNVDPENELDFGWGVYDFVTHYVDGDSLFIIQLADASYRKLKVTELTVGGVYNFTYAALDGSNEMSLSLDKADYAGKNFGYYSIQNNESLDREPLNTAWDLLFTQYTAFIPTPYTVAGVLHNAGVTIAQADGVDQDTETGYEDFEFSEEINTIGYDWKNFNGMSFDVADDLVFFVQDQEGAIWKLVFTGFGGSANGNYEFTKELLSGASTGNTEEQSRLVSLYPNPSEGNAVNCIYSSEASGEKVNIRILDMNGALVREEVCIASQGVNNFTMNIEDVASGIYTVSLNNGKSVSNQKLVVR